METHSVNKFEWDDELVGQFATSLRNNKEQDRKDHKSWRDSMGEFKQKVKEESLPDSDKDFFKNIGFLMCNGLGEVADMICKVEAQKRVDELLNQKPEQAINSKAFVWDEDTAIEYGKYCVINKSWLQWVDFKESLQPTPEHKEQQEWEIVSFKADQFHMCGYLLEKNLNGTFGGWDTDETHLLASSVHSIHSVRRLSDGVVFTVGDKVNYGVIEKMVISWVGLEVQFTDGCGATLALIEKTTPPSTVTTANDIYIDRNNDDVAILSINDIRGISRIYGMIEKTRWFKTSLYDLRYTVNQKLKK